MSEQKEHNIEFDKVLNRKIENYLDKTDTCLIDLNLREPLKKFLLHRLNLEQDNYNKKREEGFTIEKSAEEIDLILNRIKQKKNNLHYNDYISNIKSHVWGNILQPYKGCIMVYIFNERQFSVIKPMLNIITRQTLLFSEYELPETTDLPLCITATKIVFSEQQTISDKTFEIRYPLLFHYTNTFNILLKLLTPKTILYAEDSHYQEQLLTVLAAHHGIPTYNMKDYTLNDITKVI